VWREGGDEPAHALLQALDEGGLRDAVVGRDGLAAVKGLRDALGELLCPAEMDE
jgi:hypothetical protein